MQKNAETYEHIDPALVGNAQRVLVSDLSGRSNLLYKAARVRHRPGERRRRRCAALLAELKELEAQGYAFEGAEASFELLMQKALDGDRARFFRLIGFRVIDEKRHEDEPPIAEATIMLEGPDGADRAHGRAGQRPGERARPRAAQGAREVLPRDRARSGCTTTRCACSAAPRARRPSCAC